MKEGGGEDPYLAFLYPLSDGYFTGHAPGRGRPVLRKASGGHHLSPLSPTPWIQAMLGLWSPRTRALAREVPPIPTANTGVKGFLLGCWEETEETWKRSSLHPDPPAGGSSCQR